MATGYEDLIPTKDVSEKKSNDYSNLNSRDDYSDLIPSQTYAEEKPRKSIIDQGLAVAKESLVGGISGAFAPEVIQKTGQAIKTGGRALGPYGRIPTAVGSAIEAGGVAMKASRPASFAAGTIGGAGGETAGQVVESKYGPGIGAETARLLGATLTPLPFEFLGTRAGGLIGTLASK